MNNKLLKGFFCTPCVVYADYSTVWLRLITFTVRFIWLCSYLMWQQKNSTLLLSPSDTAMIIRLVALSKVSKFVLKWIIHGYAHELLRLCISHSKNRQQLSNYILETTFITNSFHMRKVMKNVRSVSYVLLATQTGNEVVFIFKHKSR